MQSYKIFYSPTVKSFISILFLIVNIGFLVWYIFYGYQMFFHSDSAMKVLLANEIFETGNYFPTDWNYANRDLQVFGGHTFILPLLAFMPAGYAVHAVSGLIWAILILSGVWFVSSLTDASTAKRIAVVAIVAAGVSGLVAENLFGQVSYGKTFCFACYIVFFTWKVLESFGSSRKYFGFALFFTIIVVCWSNPFRSFVYYVAPLFCAILSYFWCFFTKNTKKIQRALNVLVIISIGFFLGAVLHLVTLASVNNVLGVAHVRWLSYELMLRNSSYIFEQFLTIFNGLLTAGCLVASARGLYEAISFVGAVGLLVLMAFAYRKFFVSRYSSTVFFAIFAFISFVLVLLFQITTTLPQMSDITQSSRYLIPSLLLLAVTTILFTCDCKKNPVFTISITIVCTIFIVSAYPVFMKSDSDSNFFTERSQVRQGKVNLTNLAGFLEDNKLHYGYASYWNAGVLSVLSDGKSLVRQIEIENGLPVPMRWLSSDRWYLPQAWVGETFLLLTDQEALNIDWDVLAVHKGKPVRELSFENYRVFVFRENIAKGMPYWDTNYEFPVSFPVTKTSLHTIGGFVEKFSGEKSALVASKKEIGMLHFGPYIDVGAGNYKVTFDVSASENPNGVCHLDIVSAAGEKIHTEKRVISANSPQSLFLSLDQLEKGIEFRVVVLGNEQVVFKGISIERI